MGFRCGCDEATWRRLVLDRRALIGAGVSAAAVAAAGPVLIAQAAARTQVLPRNQSSEVASAPSPIVGETSFLTPLVEIYGQVEVGQRCFVAGNTILLANEGLQITFGDECNCQDNAFLLAQEANLIFGSMVSIAHHAVVENSTIHDFTFFGFRCRVRSATIEEGVMVMHQALVENVTIPANRVVPPGARITTQEQADALPELVEANEVFKEEVQSVNVEFASGYIELYNARGGSAFVGVGPNPVTSWNPDMIDPTLGEGVVLAELVRIVGDVRLSVLSTVGQRTSIRADEGTPIVIGHRARIGARVTFHALQGTSIEVGADGRFGDGNVVHGPLAIGNNFTSEDDCVVFRATIEDNVTVRQGATVAGPSLEGLILREGTVVPEFAVVLTQEDADALPVL